jgi:hypothetical protein
MSDERLRRTTFIAHRSSLIDRALTNDEEMVKQAIASREQGDRASDER